NTIDTTVMMEAAMPARMTWATCGSACEGNRMVGTHVLVTGNSSSSHDRNAPAQPSATAMVRGRIKKPPRRLYIAWRSVNGRLFLMALSVQVEWARPAHTQKKRETAMARLSLNWHIESLALWAVLLPLGLFPVCASLARRPNETVRCVVLDGSGKQGIGFARKTRRDADNLKSCKGARRSENRSWQHWRPCLP